MPEKNPPTKTVILIAPRVRRHHQSPSSTYDFNDLFYTHLFFGRIRRRGGQRATHRSEGRPGPLLLSVWVRARPHSASDARAGSISSARRLRRNKSRISVRVSPSGLFRNSLKISSAIGFPSESPKIQRADCSAYFHAARAARKCTSFIMFDESSSA